MKSILAKDKAYHHLNDIAIKRCSDFFSFVKLLNITVYFYVYNFTIVFCILLKPIIKVFVQGAVRVILACFMQYLNIISSIFNTGSCLIM